MTYEDEELMEKSERTEPISYNSLENTVSQSVVSQIQQNPEVKHNISYIPIKRIKGKLVAFDRDISNKPIIFDTSNPSQIESVISYAQKHRGDYELYFPPKTEEKPQEVPLDENSVERLGEEANTESIEYQNNGDLSAREMIRHFGYCSNSKCSHSTRPKVGFPDGAKLCCSVCGNNSMETQYNNNLKFNGETGMPVRGKKISEKEFKKLDQAAFNKCMFDKNYSLKDYRTYRIKLKINAGIKLSAEEKKELNKIKNSLESHIKEPNVSWEVTKRVADDLGSGITKFSGKVVKGAAKFTFKAVTYPTIGNLAADLQKRLENLVGKELYDSVAASKVSIYPNFFAQSIGGIFLSSYLYNGSKLSIIPSVVIGSYSFMECLIRHDIAISKSGSSKQFRLQYKGSEKEKACGSTIGKLISLPFDGVIAIKDYLAKHADEVRNKNYQDASSQNVSETKSSENSSKKTP